MAVPELQPRDGMLELRVVEPLEEITYLVTAIGILAEHYRSASDLGARKEFPSSARLE